MPFLPIRASFFVVLSALTLATGSFAQIEVERLTLGSLQPQEIDEASGASLGRRSPGILYTHNDGSNTKFYALEPTGELRTTYTLAGVTAVDIEDMAIATLNGTHYLYLADIGDNSAVRSEVRIFRVAEPLVNSQAQGTHVTLSSVATMRLRYPDGARDAEALMISPQSNRIYIISKRENKSRLYRASWSTGSITTLEFVMELGFGGVVAADVSPTGNEVLVKTIDKVRLFESDNLSGLTNALSSVPKQLSYQREPQGEAIAWSPDASSYITVSEGIGQPIYGYVILTVLQDGFESATLSEWN